MKKAKGGARKVPKPPFDFRKASFYLVAFVVVAHVLIVFLGLGVCFWNYDLILANKAECDTKGKLSELLSTALAAAIAFTGMTRGGFK
jgi:hypothetical protein